VEKQDQHAGEKEEEYFVGGGGSNGGRPFEILQINRFTRAQHGQKSENYGGLAKLVAPWQEYART